LIVASTLVLAYTVQTAVFVVFLSLPMNDLEFVQHVSAPLGQLYGEAKRSARQFPRNTLIAARSMASMCCDLLRRHEVVDWPDGLEEKIRALEQARRINRDTRDRLTQLRRWGNAAAHPEASLIDETHQSERAGRALSATIALLETVFQEVHHGAAVPAYWIVEDDTDELQATCYRALFDNKPGDQHQVALLLRHQLDTKIAEVRLQPDPELEMYRLQWEFRALENRALDLLRYASDASHPPSQYLYGLALAEGVRGPEMVMLGVNLIATACRDGDIDALAWCGDAALYGRFDEPVNYTMARNYLQRAAVEDHPIALRLLSVIHREGLGVELDAKMAFSLTLRAADAGYAVAQYEAGVALLYGKGIEANHQEAFKWMRRASDAGLAEAKYALARSMLEHRISGEAAEVEALLVASLTRVNAAHLDLADLYLSGQDLRKWMEAGALIQTAYEVALRGDNKELIQRCLSAAPPLIAKLEGALPMMPDGLVHDFISMRFMFDEKGRPYPSRSVRIERRAELMRELVKIRGTGSSQERRLQSELGSNMGGLKLLPALRPRPVSAQPLAQRMTSTRVGRNAPCPCGSGRKYKQCHA
jgi:TPR repeat protein